MENAGTAYFRKTMFLKYFPASFILTQGVAIGLGYARLSALPNTVRVAAATGFTYIYMKNAAAAYCRPPLFLKHFPESFILPQGDAIGPGFFRL